MWRYVMTKNKTIIVLGLAFVAPIAFALTPFDNSATKSAVKEEANSLANNIKDEIDELSSDLNKSITNNTAALSNAIRGAIAQEALSASQISQAHQNALILQSDIENAAKIAEKTLEIKLNYGSETGQGYAVCKVLAQNRQLDSAVSTATLETDTKVHLTDNAAGKLASDETAYAQKRARFHADNFCTQEEIDAKLCNKLSDMPGLDSNAAILFSSAKAGTKLAEAKTAVRQNILGSPDLAIPKSMGGTAQGQAYLYNTNRKAALTAFPAYSLAYLESMSEKREDLKGPNGEPMSPNDLIYVTVSRYYGSDESKEWAKSMVQQVPRGMLVELAKMEGLGAWMDYQEYLSNMRIEGNIASMTLTTTLPMEEELNRKMNTIARANTTRHIALSD